ncbi:MAG: NfeD family protein [Alphaproteobacteria bacterium]|nr:NfeD family protein [Alphaproteobacteria bacterium]
MAEIFASYGDWFWWILAGVMFVLELLVPAFFFLWFGFAAVATGLVVLVIPMAWQLQGVTFAVLAVVSLVVSRKFFARPATGTDMPNLNQRVQSYVGKSYPLETAISNRRGKVRIHDSNWEVRGPDAPAGTWVKVVSADGATLNVELEADQSNAPA